MFLMVNLVNGRQVLFQLIEIICPINEEIIPRSNAEKDSQGQIKSAPLTRMYPPIEKDIKDEILSLGFNL